MKERNVIAFSTYFTWLCCSRLGQALQTSRDWKKAFVADIKISGHFLASNAASQLSCASLCQDSCLSFGWQATSGSCWLYDHLAVFRLSGPPAPATAYFWALAPRCPTDRNYTLEAGVCFKVFTDPRSWTQASAVCAEEGGHLYVGDPPAKLDLLLGTFSVAIWVGASDADVEGQWHWVDGGNVTAPWESGQPDNFKNVQHCARLKTTGSLDDAGGQSLVPFACEIPMS